MSPGTPLKMQHFEWGCWRRSTPQGPAQFGASACDFLCRISVHVPQDFPASKLTRPGKVSGGQQNVKSAAGPMLEKNRDFVEKIPPSHQARIPGGDAAVIIDRGSICSCPAHRPIACLAL